jgi:DNA repair protein RecO
MSYHIYTTDGIVLKRNNFGESNSLFFILTVDLGLIIASAQAVRMSNSKLNQGLQEYSLCSVSCVKGKNGWKITNATAKKNFFFGRPIFVQKLVSQISVVLLRMMPGEQKHQEVFSVVLAGFSALKNVDEKNLDNTGSFEILMMLRILYHLGYVEKNSQSQTENFLQDDLDWNEKILSEVAVAKIELIKLINKGLEESQL